MRKKMDSSLPGLDMEATGANIGKIIKAMGYTDKQIAEKMGLSPQAVNKWRHGSCVPDIENLYILSNILGITVDRMLIPQGREKDSGSEVLTATEWDIYDPQQFFVCIEKKGDMKEASSKRLESYCSKLVS